jgi:hypothetical protein
MNDCFELHRGQMVPWSKSPAGQAQIVELCRTNVELAYRRDGRLVRTLAPAERVAWLIEQEPTLFTADNQLELGVVPKRKTYLKGKHYGFPRGQLSPTRRNVCRDRLARSGDGHDDLEPAFPRLAAQ